MGNMCDYLSGFAYCLSDGVSRSNSCSYLLSVMEAGPEIPPHILEKRKRKAEEAAASITIADSIHNRPETPTLEKRPRIIGPALPPSPLDERPSHSPQEEEGDSSSDEIGPSLPSGLAPEVKLAFPHS